MPGSTPPAGGRCPSAPAPTCRSNPSSKRGSIARPCPSKSSCPSRPITTTCAGRATTSDSPEKCEVLTHPTVSKLHTLRLNGMAAALAEQAVQPDIDRLGFDERFGLLVDREPTERDSRRLKLRLGQARLRQSACLEDLDYRTPRGLDRTL